MYKYSENQLQSLDTILLKPVIFFEHVMRNTFFLQIFIYIFLTENQANQGKKRTIIFTLIDK